MLKDIAGKMFERIRIIIAKSSEHKASCASYVAKFSLSCAAKVI